MPGYSTMFFNLHFEVDFLWLTIGDRTHHAVVPHVMSRRAQRVHAVLKLN